MTTITVRKWGDSQGIILSKTLLARMGLRVGDKLDVEICNSSIVMSPQKQRVIRPKDIDVLFAGFEGDCRSIEDELAQAVGKEIL